MGTRAAALGAGVLAALLVASACFPERGPMLILPEGGTPPATTVGGFTDATTLDEVELGPAFAVSGLQPSHGPWSGGTRTTLSGRGFSSDLQVTIGGTQLPASNVFASAPTTVVVETPPGAPGPANVTVVNVSTAASSTLPAGFIYDAFAVTPTGGATTGGTRIALKGSGTAWTAGSTVQVGGLACTAVTFTDATDLACTTPPNGPGSQSIRVTNTDGSSDEADDAFLYSDSPDGFRGGLYGSALAGTLTVLGFDAWTGTPLQGGIVIAGSSLPTAVLGTLDASGTAQLTGPTLTGQVTVTVAAACHQPMTYVDVPVDTVTVYLTPALDPACASNPGSTGNYIPEAPGTVTGQLVWTAGIEFQRAGWTTVPLPAPGERQAAYVFDTSGNPVGAFYYPDPSTATTPSSPGDRGYGYSVSLSPGNSTLYALAGLEEDADSGGITRFEPFAMGVVKGVPVQPNVTTAAVDIPMNTVLDRALSTVIQAPPTTARGPDRVISSLSINLGAGFFAPLPQGTITNLLPVPGDVSFVGIPALDGTIAGASYELSAAAVSGQAQADPLSVVSGIQTTDANDPLTIGGFFDIPVLVEPSTTTWSGTHVTLQASGPVDLAVINLATGNNLVVWQVVAPGTDLSFDLPDLTQVKGIEQLVHGPLLTTFDVARINGFQYGQLHSGQLGASSWSAYAEDSVFSSY